MIKQIIDLHIHSKYSRACSPDLELPKIAFACQQKGIDIVATGDFTHPAWFEHIKTCLVEDTPGIYVLNSQFSIPNFQTIFNPKFSNKKIKFILSTEIACIYK